MNKTFAFLISSFVAFSCFANTLPEQILSTKNKNCSIHYLTSKQKNLWSIEINENYCHDGWVHGFSDVILKDSLDRSAKTLHGYFHQGYWLSDFPGQLDETYIFSPTEKEHDFIFKTTTDPELEVDYYAVARATEQKDGSYNAFELCPTIPLIFVVHKQEEDFKKSLFQSNLLKQAKTQILKQCPQVQKFQIWGMTQLSQNFPWVFKGTFDFKSQEITLNYRSKQEAEAVPRPSELRHEQAENLLTIRPINPPLKQQENQITQNDDKQPSGPTKLSATDLALLAQILRRKQTGEVIVYIQGQRKDYSYETSRPTSLILQSKESLAIGWYLISGTFESHDGKVEVQVSSAKRCLKEWCANEN